MPWQTPNLRKVREMVRDDITASLYGAAFIGNNVLRVMADAMAGLAHHVLRYIDWLALQLLPDTAETEWLDRHGDIWLKNADGTVGRKMPTFASGSVTFTGTGGMLVPLGTRFGGTGGGSAVEYETLEQILLLADAPTPARSRALDPGTAGNVEANTRLAVSSPLVNVDNAVTVVVMTGGTEQETDNELRYRVLQRIRQPPMGGSQHDYVQWTLAVPGVTRAWCGPLEMGIGTVTVRFLMDNLRADNDGWPEPPDVDAVQNYLDTMRPVAVKDFFVTAPIKQRVDAIIAGLVPDSLDVRAAIETSLQSMLHEFAAPGQTIFAAWKTFAIMNAPGIESFRLANNLDDVMQSPGHMAVLGDILFVD